MSNMKIKMEIWDNDLTAEEKQDILLYCEHAINKVLEYAPDESILQYKITERWYGGWTADIEYAPCVDIWALIRRYNVKLMRLHYWNREDEPLVMNWEWKQ